MAESFAHRELVRLLSEYISSDVKTDWARFVDARTFETGGGIPPMIDGYRPDVYAIERSSSRIIIGEAKTANDIDNDHTRGQLAAYFRHLADDPQGEVWLAVPMASGGTAHRICRTVRASLTTTSPAFVVTGWFFGPKPLVETWRG